MSKRNKITKDDLLIVFTLMGASAEGQKEDPEQFKKTNAMGYMMLGVLNEASGKEYAEGIASFESAVEEFLPRLANLCLALAGGEDSIDDWETKMAASIASKDYERIAFGGLVGLAIHKSTEK